MHRFSFNLLFNVVFGLPQVLSRGRILSSKKTSVSDGGSWSINQELKINITRDMVPSARLVVFFISSTGVVGGDSLWIDVQDRCQHQNKVRLPE